MLSASKSKPQAAAALPVHRETPMTQPEARYYKESFRTSKNVNHMQSSNHIAHVAPTPDSHPRGDAMVHARMQKSSIQMFPDARDKDTFTSPAKRSNQA